MPLPHLTSTCLILTTLLWVPSAKLHAAPPVTKPRLVPRPVPGMSGTPAVSVVKPSVQAAQTRKAPSPTQPMEVEPATHEVRILQIIRKGSPGLPPSAPEQNAASTSSPTPHQQGVTTPRVSAGRVRILTQAEAEVLAAQIR